MKHLGIILAFLAGVAVASGVWGYYLVTTQIEMAVNYVSMADGEANISEHILSYVDHPDPATAHLLIFSATNHIGYFSNDVDYWDKRYPYMHIKRRFASRIEGFQTFLQTNNLLHAKQQPNTALEPTPTAPPVLTKP
jgi:hypothetical protein